MKFIRDELKAAANLADKVADLLEEWDNWDGPDSETTWGTALGAPARRELREALAHYREEAAADA